MIWKITCFRRCPFLVFPQSLLLRNLCISFFVPALSLLYPCDESLTCGCLLVFVVQHVFSHPHVWRGSSGPFPLGFQGGLGHKVLYPSVQLCATALSETSLQVQVHRWLDSSSEKDAVRRRRLLHR